MAEKFGPLIKMTESEFAIAVLSGKVKDYFNESVETLFGPVAKWPTGIILRCKEHDQRTHYLYWKRNKHPRKLDTSYGKWHRLEIIHD